MQQNVLFKSTRCIFKSPVVNFHTIRPYRSILRIGCKKSTISTIMLSVALLQCAVDMTSLPLSLVAATTVRVTTFLSNGISIMKGGIL